MDLLILHNILYIVKIVFRIFYVGKSSGNSNSNVLKTISRVMDATYHAGQIFSSIC